MAGLNFSAEDVVGEDEYLLDPPETVWQDILKADHAAWLDIKHMEVIRAAEERTRSFGSDLTREAWLGLYSPANPLKGQAPEGMAVAHSIYRRAEEMDEWKGLRTSIGPDEVAAAFGAAHFAKELIARLPPEIAEKMHVAQEAQDGLADLRAQMQALQAAVDRMGAGSSGTTNAPAKAGGKAASKEELTRRLHELEGAEQRARGQAKAAESEALQALEDASARTEQALAQSVADAAASLADLSNAAQELGFGWGLGPSAGATRQEIESLHELAGRLKASRHLKQILEALGWAKRVVSAERRKSRHGREKFTHYRTQEIDLETIAPEELVGLVDPDPGSPLALDFLRRAADGELLHRQYEGDDQAGKGPFVVLIDKSGSMHGQPNATACALELALMKLAREERRRFVSIPFSGQGQFQVYDPGPRPDPRSLIEHLELFYGGGTEPYAPLQAAIELVKEDSSLREGDLLLITDGTFAAPPVGFLECLTEAREEPGLKLVAVVVKAESGQAGFADKVVRVSDLFEDRERLGEAIGALL
jgi:uncharacterized protein with von Willebrand factor type A (vWA) domain